MGSAFDNMSHVSSSATSYNQSVVDAVVEAIANNTPMFETWMIEPVYHTIT